jgi:hypothetical protein
MFIRGTVFELVGPMILRSASAVLAETDYTVFGLGSEVSRALKLYRESYVIQLNGWYNGAAISLALGMDGRYQFDSSDSYGLGYWPDQASAAAAASYAYAHLLEKFGREL